MSHLKVIVSQTKQTHMREALMKITCNVAEVLHVHQMDVQKLQNTCPIAHQRIFV
jgi:hypothetical protein